MDKLKKAMKRSSISLNDVITVAFGVVILLFIAFALFGPSNRSTSTTVKTDTNKKDIERVEHIRAYNTQAYAEAKTKKERMQVLNRAYDQVDLRSLQQINKLYPSNFTRLALAATDHYYYRKTYDKGSTLKISNAAMKALSNMSFKNKSVKRQYEMFDAKLIREINLMIKEYD